jgi:catechol 2,3-dioxygenase-like lactoylglutathione lyase family enzyme
MMNVGASRHLGRYELAERSGPEEDMVVCHFIVSDDVERSRRFYTEVLGGRVVFSGDVTNVNVALANSFIVINVGGGPTDDKPTVNLETPPDPASSFLNIRVKDIQAKYEEWSARGGGIPDAAQAAPVRDSLLHPRSRRISD